MLVVGEDTFQPLDIRVRVKGGGHVSQVYAIRQAIAKAVVAYYAKYVDAYSAMELKKKLVAYDRSLLIADPRRMEPKKFGGAGARARRQKRSVAFSLAHRVANHEQLSVNGCISLPGAALSCSTVYHHALICNLWLQALYKNMHGFSSFEFDRRVSDRTLVCRWLLSE